MLDATVRDVTQLREQVWIYHIGDNVLHLVGAAGLKLNWPGFRM
jgi:hypothetical protein